MKEICERARSAMNLLLLFCVLLAWLIVTDVPTILDRVASIQELLLTSAAPSRPMPVQDFLTSVAPPKQISELRRIKISTVLAMDSEDLRRLEFPLAQQLVLPPMEPPLDRRREPSPRAIRGRAAENPLAMIRAELKELAVLTARGRLSPESTLGELEASTSPELTLPFVERTIDVQTAYWVLGIACAGPLLLLLSFASSLREVASNQHLPVILDWLPLHPGRLAVVLGAFWLYLAPCLLIIGLVAAPYRFMNSLRDYAYAIGLALGLSLLAAATWSRLTAIRAQQLKHEPTVTGTK